jgi:hypothetical protein
MGIVYFVKHVASQRFLNTQRSTRSGPPAGPPSSLWWLMLTFAEDRRQRLCVSSSRLFIYVTCFFLRHVFFFTSRVFFLRHDVVVHKT